MHIRQPPIDALAAISACLAQQGRTLIELATISQTARRTARMSKQSAERAAALLIDATHDIDLMAQHLSAFRSYVETKPAAVSVLREAIAKHDQIVAASRVKFERQSLLTQLQEEAASEPKKQAKHAKG